MTWSQRVWLGLLRLAHWQHGDAERVFAAAQYVMRRFERKGIGPPAWEAIKPFAPTSHVRQRRAARTS